MKNLFFAFLLITSSTVFSQKDNLLKNGGFENNFNNWELNTLDKAKAFFKNDKKTKFSGEKSLNVEVVDLGANTWDIHMVQPFTSRKNSKYQIQFYAKANRSGKILKAQLQNTTYTGREFQLTDEWKLYTWESKAKEDDLALAFHFLGKGTYYIDNIVVEKLRKNNNKKPSSNNASNKYSGSKSTTMIGNGGFEDGFADWVNVTDGGGKADFKLNRRSPYEGESSMKVTLLKPGKNQWDVQSFKEINVKKNKTYKLTFYARSVGNKKVKVQVQDDFKKIYKSTTFNAGFEWEKFSWDFKAGSSQMQLAIHHIGLGTVEYDSIKIEQIKKK